MVRDLMIEMKEHDLLTEDKSSDLIPTFDTLWGKIFENDEENDILICNIIIPEAYWNTIKYEANELICRFTSAYIPEAEYFRIRLVGLKSGKYYLFETIRGSLGLPVNSFALSKNIASPITACMLPFIDIDGEFLVRFIQNEMSELLDKAYIYSSKQTDLQIGFSDNQSAQLLSLCAPGNYYRYPTTGVGIAKYLNSVVSHSDLQDSLKVQFEGDEKSLYQAEFDNTTGKLDVVFSPEKEIEDSDLIDIDNIDFSFFDQFTDEYVRRNIVVDELSDTDFMDLLNGYQSIQNILFFIDQSTGITRIANRVVAGKFNGLGEIVESEEYFIVSSTLEANTIVMFDDEREDEESDSPVFIIDDTDESRLYTALVEQPYWISTECHKCFILKKRAEIKYTIRQDQFRNGKGLFIIPQTSANIKNMLGIVQDTNTGRLLGIVSNNTNISDITLDEVTQHIYASQIIQ